MVPPKVRSSVAFVWKYKATALLVLLSVFFLIVRSFVYRYPEGKPSRNPIDYTCDVVGYAYHFLMFTFDYSFRTGLKDVYHAEQALRYQPDDTYMQRFTTLEVEK